MKNLPLLPFFYFLSWQTFASTYLTLSGNVQNSNSGLSETKSRLASGTVAFDVGSFLRLGFTHRQKFEDALGFRKNEDETEYTRLRLKAHQITNSIDLTLILYSGQLFVPYLKGGIIVKTESVELQIEDEIQKPDPITYPAQPSAGAGVGIRLNRNFTLKISYEVSPSVKIDPITEEPQRALDTYTEVGLSYKI